MQAPTRGMNLEQMNNYLFELYNNMGIGDLKPSGVRTEAPTTETLSKGRFEIVELSGVPYVYYNSLAGVLYRKQMDAA